MRDLASTAFTPGFSSLSLLGGEERYHVTDFTDCVGIWHSEHVGLSYLLCCT
jgi:hypothetical protein